MPALARSIAGITSREGERFGGTIGELVSTVRRVLEEPRDLAPDVEARLRARLGFVPGRERRSRR